VGETPVQLVAIGAAIVTAVMVATWRVAVRLANASIVDASWAGSIGLLAALYAACGAGYAPRRALAAALALAWSARLALHLGRRSLAHPEDGRYAQLRRRWQPDPDRKFLAFFLVQGATDVVLSLPFLLACFDPTPGLRAVELAAAALAALAVLGEALADRQLAAFARDPENRGRVCQRGLWRWSRHPNYFFESLVWVAFALFALPAPYGGLALVAPALITATLLFATGIPATEEQALRSRGDAYREYQRTTSAFVPWPPAR
jgi:steroid 5-alpha reductase family enzyme